MTQAKLFRKDFTLVVIGQIISLFGNAILRFALPLYLLRETGSAALFGAVTACSFVPMIFLSFVGGVFADRVNKRNIMVVLDFVTALIILVFSIALGNLPLVPLMIVALMLLYGISGAYQPAVQASIPVLVSGEHILTASAIINQVSSLAGLLGPILGGVLFGAFGIYPILWISTVCFVFSAVMEIFIHIPGGKPATQEKLTDIIKSDVRDSLHYIKTEKPMLLKVIVLISLFNLVLSAMMVVGMPVIIVDTLGMSDSMLGFSQGVTALGGLCGGILTAVLGAKLSLQKSHFLLLLCGLSIGVMAIPLLFGAAEIVSYSVITLSAFVAMALATMFSVQMLAAVQIETPQELVGKVLALMLALAMCAQPVGQAIYGLLFEYGKDHIGFILLAVCAVSAVIALVSQGIWSGMSLPQTPRSEEA